MNYGAKLWLHSKGSLKANSLGTQGVYHFTRDMLYILFETFHYHLSLSSHILYNGVSRT